MGASRIMEIYVGLGQSTDDVSMVWIFCLVPYSGSVWLGNLTDYLLACTCKEKLCHFWSGLTEIYHLCYNLLGY